VSDLRPRASIWRSVDGQCVQGQLLLRSALVILFVLASHILEWPNLEYTTSAIILTLSEWLGVPGARVSLDTIELAGENYQFLASCTFVDVFMGSIALVWQQQRSVAANCTRLTIWAGVLFAFNAFRLELAVLGHLGGIPWHPVEGIVGGLAYFLVWLVIWNSRSWSVRGDRPTPV
jgi:hypothetical protein